MKLDIHYLSDSEGTTQAVQIPIDDWNKVMATITKYERVMKVKADLQEAFLQVDHLQKKRTRKKTLSQFLNEL